MNGGQNAYRAGAQPVPAGGFGGAPHAGLRASDSQGTSSMATPAQADHGASAHSLPTNGLPSINQAGRSLVKRSGILVIRVMEARNLVYPPGSQQLMARYAPYKNEAHQRPYAVVEFDKNEAVVTSLGGDMQNPIWKYRVNL
ncbi:Serine/threonine-protein kinase [Coemansia sp. RSA 2708]|nr:Serine/threonine-protein kinase [Coemansia sp. RSA 2708]